MIRRGGLAFAALLLCVGAAPENQPATIAEAAQQAFMMGCLLHVSQASTIDDKDPARAKAMGLTLTEKGAPPEVLGPGPAGTGRKVVAKIESKQGPVWITAFPDTRWCIIYALGGDTKDVATKLHETLEVKGSWWTLVNTEADPKSNSLFLSYATGKNEAGDQLGVKLRTPVVYDIPGADWVMLIAYPNNN